MLITVQPRSSDIPCIPDSDCAVHAVIPMSIRMALRSLIRWSPCKAPAVPAKGLPAAEPADEERTPSFNQKYFYPARLEEVLNNRYQIAVKLGFGTSSTVWLARDLHQYKHLFQSFISRILRWRPGDRGSVEELLSDPWFQE
jgi:hypothetical protein